MLLLIYRTRREINSCWPLSGIIFKGLVLVLLLLVHQPRTTTVVAESKNSLGFLPV
jgi:hypothetical protein